MPTTPSAPRRRQETRERLPSSVRSVLSAGKRAAWFSIGRMAPTPTRPILVLGNQKSGTTAVGALLARYAGLSATLDFRYLTPNWLRGVHDGSVPFQAFLRHHAFDFSRGLVKEPNLSLLYPHLLRAFPEAEVVMIVRDPRDNIRSVLNRLNLRGDMPPPPGWADSVNPLWELVVDGKWLGLGGGTHVESLASRWSAIADVYLEHTDRVRLLRYEDFMADKEGAVAGLAALCGLEQKADIADQLDVAYQPRGDRAVTWSAFFGDDALRRIDARCGDRLDAFGYPPSTKTGVPADPAASPPAR